MEQKLAAYRYYIERMLRLPLSHSYQLREWQTMSHNHIQQLTNHLATKAKTTNTKQNNEATPNQKHREQHKVGYIHLLITIHSKNHKSIQTHKHQNRLQIRQHSSTAHKTCLRPQHPTPQ